jgi:uncharacterized membrane protein YgcG
LLSNTHSFYFIFSLLTLPCQVTMRLLHDTKHLSAAKDVPARARINALRDAATAATAAAVTAECSGTVVSAGGENNNTDDAAADAAMALSLIRIADWQDWQRRRYVALLLACKAGMHMLAGNAAAARALLSRAVYVDDDCAFARYHFFLYNLRFAGVAEAVPHLRLGVANNFLFQVGCEFVTFPFALDPAHVCHVTSTGGAGSGGVGGGGGSGGGVGSDTGGGSLFGGGCGIVSLLPAPDADLLKQHTAYR